jgi:mRNA-degrading endonuclease toxin of MazEF toxin-antitoxin module
VRVSHMHWGDLPAANGREQRGRRPAVVLQKDDYGGNLPMVLVVPLTTARAAMRIRAGMPQGHFPGLRSGRASATMPFGIPIRSDHQSWPWS